MVLAGREGTRHAAGKKVSSERRRLTLGTIDRPLKKENGNEKEDTRGLVLYLQQKGTQDLAPAPKKVALGSVTSGVTEGFDEKRHDQQSIDSLNDLGCGVVCKKGQKPESPNQDSFSFCHHGEEFTLFGVYDGHGQTGHHVSNWVKDNLPKLFISNPSRKTNPKQALQDCFLRTQKLIESQMGRATLADPSMSGTTCTLVYMPHNERKKRIVVAHVGDSRLVLMKQGSKPGATPIGKELTMDHKPNLPAEKERIERNGGRVVFDGFFNHRVFAKGAMYPGLNMSRAFGDVIAHQQAGLSAVPDVNEFEIGPDDLGFLLCTDGVWEFIDDNAATKIVHEVLKRGDSVQLAAETLAQASWDAWMRDSEGEISDDITAMVTLFDHDKAKKASSASSGGKMLPHPVK